VSGTGPTYLVQAASRRTDPPGGEKGSCVARRTALGHFVVAAIAVKADRRSRDKYVRFFFKPCKSLDQCSRSVHTTVAYRFFLFVGPPQSRDVLPGQVDNAIESF